jgi:hypothetical protein
LLGVEPEVVEALRGMMMLCGSDLEFRSREKLEQLAEEDFQRQTSTIDRVSANNYRRKGWLKRKHTIQVQ